jgi:hypothetical protein
MARFCLAACFPDPQDFPYQQVEISSLAAVVGVTDPHGVDSIEGCPGKYRQALFLQLNQNLHIQVIQDLVAQTRHQVTEADHVQRYWC